ncbi:hypothetical protein X975_15890, partial [Stegodyphus mimosarum]
MFEISLLFSDIEFKEEILLLHRPNENLMFLTEVMSLHSCQGKKFLEILVLGMLHIYVPSLDQYEAHFLLQITSSIFAALTE